MPEKFSSIAVHFLWCGRGKKEGNKLFTFQSLDSVSLGNIVEGVQPVSIRQMCAGGLVPCHPS